MNIILTQEFKRAQIYDAIFIFLILTEIPFCWNNLPPDLIYSIVVTGSEISNFQLKKIIDFLNCFK